MAGNGTPDPYEGSTQERDLDLHAIDLTRAPPSPGERRADLIVRVVLIGLALLWLLQAA